MKDPKRRSSEERLLDAAKSLFVEQGYEATTVSQITKAAGTSYSQFLKYFSGKDELRAEILDDLWAQLNSAIVLATTTAPSGSEKLMLALNMFVNFVEGDPTFRAILLLETVVVRGRNGMSVNGGYGEFIRIIDDIFDAMNTAGELVAGTDAQALRSALVGSVEGMLRDRLLAEKSSDGAKFSQEQVRSVLSSFLGAHLDVKRPSSAASSAKQKAQSVSEIVSGDDDWIRYYLALADKALGPAEMA
jgi:AcrR family transcriptional regulator